MIRLAEAVVLVETSVATCTVGDPGENKKTAPQLKEQRVLGGVVSCDDR